ncbi:hypothetical protein BCL57_001306 [Agromyces flavus]|uniref:Glutaminase n=1 Tax=Agromyces flavus TaxID=589382 RepID=A0A1H1ZMW1_9MICO|nr:hypothetical protein [Agromyces flavus]MCP2367152.1 hypothetical protein [Agromyces flavus]GGI46299.1 hypothetical protein GCM10010932_13900 [Agromyces flavus]SDT34566.1 hypothetical protein SAMN04489721_3231 [Agromyces flavus]
MGEADGSAAVARARDAVARAVQALGEASARTETLAEFVPSRRVLGMPRAPRMRVIGPVWRLGVLLLDADGRVYGTGRVIRAERAARKSVTAESVAVQRAYRAAAVKGGIAEGTTVVFDAEPVELDAAVLAADATSGPLVLTSGADGSSQLAVRWNPARDDALIPFESYLAERVDLLLNPPQGA